LLGLLDINLKGSLVLSFFFIVKTYIFFCVFTFYYSSITDKKKNIFYKKNCLILYTILKRINI